MEFSRTISGKLASYLFYREILIWVEGSDDIPFFDRIVRNKHCRLENANGKSECLKLSRGIIEQNLPYVVILDGDYEILERKRSPHRRIVILNRYSIENYLFEEEPIERVCRNYAQVGDDVDILDGTYHDVLDRIENELLDLIVLDVAHYRQNTGEDVLPSRAEPLLDNPRILTFSTDRIQDICNKLQIECTALAESQDLINKYIRFGRIVDVVNGHIIFGIIRHLIINAVRRIRNRNPNIDNDGLLILLSTEAWSLSESRDHNRLKNRLFRAIRDAHLIRYPN